MQQIVTVLSASSIPERSSCLIPEAVERGARSPPSGKVVPPPTEGVRLAAMHKPFPYLVRAHIRPRQKSVTLKLK